MKVKMMLILCEPHGTAGIFDVSLGDIFGCQDCKVMKN